jgi:methionyl-tRNA synthetase
MTMEIFKDAYNSQLANGIGNLTNRILKMAISNEVQFDSSSWNHTSTVQYKEWQVAFESFDINKAADVVWKKIGEMDAQIQSSEPFKLVKTDPEAAKAIIAELVQDLSLVAELATPILPDTSAKIKECINERKMPEQPLFLRKD